MSFRIACHKSDSASTLLPLMSRVVTLVIFGTRCREQGVASGRRCATAAIWTGDDLKQMAARVVEVDPAPTVPGVDLVALVAAWVGPVCQPPFTNPFEDLVEFTLFHQEGVVLGCDLAISCRYSPVRYRCPPAPPQTGRPARAPGDPGSQSRIFAAVPLSCAATIVWFSWIAMVMILSVVRSACHPGTTAITSISTNILCGCRLDCVTSRFPGVDTAFERLDIREALRSILICPTGRCCFLRSSAIENDLPVFT